MGLYHDDVKATLDTFVDCFSCADGGISFIKFRSMMEHFGMQADAGDESAKEIVRRVQHVARLIDHASTI